MKRQLRLDDGDATERLGAQLGATLPARAIVFLHGPLGAGKSCLARAMLRSLGVVGPVKSPTYTLVERYALDEGQAAHLDLYRIAESAELEFLGLDELAGEARLWLVEWPERGAGALPAPDLEVSLEVDGLGRQVGLDARTPVGQAWLEAIFPGSTSPAGSSPVG